MKLTVENLNHINIKDAIEEWSNEEVVDLAVFSAELVIDLYKDNSDTPKKAIQSAKDWLENPTKENKNICKEAAFAAYDAASITGTVYAVYASAADAAAAAAAAVAAADIAAVALAVAAHASRDVKQKIVDYINEKNRK